MARGHDFVRLVGGRVRMAYILLSYSCQHSSNSARKLKSVAIGSDSSNTGFFSFRVI